VKRRNFLFLTTTGAIATLAPFCKTRRQPTPTTLNTPKFLAAICDPQTIRKIGTDYRATTQAEATEDALTQLLTTGGQTDQTAQLIKKINDDFATGHTVTLDGWIIAITEARQCALHSLQLS
jgi:hypothetical protein